MINIEQNTSCLGEVNPFNSSINKRLCCSYIKFDLEDELYMDIKLVLV